MLQNLVVAVVSGQVKGCFVVADDPIVVLVEADLLDHLFLRNLAVLIGVQLIEVVDGFSFILQPLLFFLDLLQPFFLNPNLIEGFTFRRFSLFLRDLLGLFLVEGRILLNLLGLDVVQTLLPVKNKFKDSI